MRGCREGGHTRQPIHTHGWAGTSESGPTVQVWQAGPELGCLVITAWPGVSQSEPWKCPLNTKGTPEPPPRGHPTLVPTYWSTFLSSWPWWSLRPGSPWNANGPSSTSRTSLSWRSLHGKQNSIQAPGLSSCRANFPQAWVIITHHTAPLTGALNGSLEPCSLALRLLLWPFLSDPLVSPSHPSTGKQSLLTHLSSLVSPGA